MDPQVWTDAVSGPASYATGGITVTTGLASVAFFRVEIDVSTGLGEVEFDVTLNSPGAGQVKVIPKLRSYDRLTATGALSGLPSGVTARSTSGGTVDTSTHTHAIDHDHASFASGTPIGGTAAALNIAGANMTSHTHTWDFANLVGTSGAETAHTHTWNSLYAHAHALTNTTTDATMVEVANGTNLSAATLNYLAVA